MTLRRIFRDISVIFLDIKKEGPRNPILNDWLLVYHSNWPSGGTAGLASLWCPFWATPVSTAPEGLSPGLTDDICNLRGQGCLEHYSRAHATEMCPCTTSTMQTYSSSVTGYSSWWQCLCMGSRSHEVPIPALSLPPALSNTPWRNL